MDDFDHWSDDDDDGSADGEDGDEQVVFSVDDAVIVNGRKGAVTDVQWYDDETSDEGCTCSLEVIFERRGVKFLYDAHEVRRVGRGGMAQLEEEHCDDDASARAQQAFEAALLARLDAASGGNPPAAQAASGGQPATAQPAGSRRLVDLTRGPYAGWRRKTSTRSPAPGGEAKTYLISPDGKTNVWEAKALMAADVLTVDAGDAATPSASSSAAASSSFATAATVNQNGGKRAREEREEYDTVSVGDASARLSKRPVAASCD